MSTPLLVLVEHRAFLVPAGVVVPGGESEARCSDGSRRTVDLAALEAHEVDADTARAWQERQLAAKLGQMGEVTRALTHLLTRGPTSATLDPNHRQAGLQRLREAAQGLRGELDAVGPDGLRDQVASAWDGPGGEGIAEAAVEVVEDLD